MTQDNENVRKVGGKVARDSKRDSCEDGSAGTKGKPGTKISTVFGRFFLFRKPNLNARVDVDSSAPAAEEVDDPRLALENLQHSTARFELNSIANANGKLAGQAKGSSKLLQIRTVPEGFNSGRTYYVRFSSNALCQEVVLELTNKANEARKKLLKLTRFQKNQELVRVVFISKYFQFTVAALIFAVCVLREHSHLLNLTIRPYRHAELRGERSSGTTECRPHHERWFAHRHWPNPQQAGHHLYMHIHL